MNNIKHKEKIAINDILFGIKDLLNKYSLKYMGTDALLELSKCGDKLINLEIDINHKY